MLISSGNVFYWHIRESHGPGGYTVTIRVTRLSRSFC